MAVIINELELVLDPPATESKPTAKTQAPEKRALSPQDFLAMMDREQRNRLRLQAH
jgi:hypothetical protein